jgi:hypothetical protein
VVSENIGRVLESYENSKLARFCSARLQAGILESSRCPPEGGRYKNQTERFAIARPLILLFRFDQLQSRPR